MPRLVDNISPFHDVSSCLTTFTIPPHLMGRSVHNPASDSTSPGRRLQKPRPGVRIPYRNLTSQIVTQEEIAQEILQRSMKKNSGSQTLPVADNVKTETIQLAASGDSVFAMRLSRRLANRLSSPKKDLEEGSNGNPEDIWAKVQAEHYDEKHHQIDVQGPISANKQPVKEVPSGDVSATTSHSTTLYSPRLNRHTTKLDRDAEREMALKQLSELPMIKGGTRELTADLVLSNSSKRTLCNSEGVLQLSVTPLNSSDLKDFEKQNATKCSDSDVNICSHQLIQGQPNVQLHICKLENFPSSTQSQDKVVLNHIEPNLISHSTKINCADKKNEEKTMEKVLQCKYSAIDNSFPKESNLRISKTLKASHCRSKKKEKLRKRRSTRLSVAHSKIEAASSQLISKNKIIPSNRKKKACFGKKKINSFLCTENHDGPAVLEKDSNVSLDRELGLCQSNLNESVLSSASLTNVCNSLLSESKIEQSNAVKAKDMKCMFSPGEMKEKNVLEGDQETLKCNSEEPSKSTSVKSAKEENLGCLGSNSEVFKKSTYVKGRKELDKLFIDEGALNLLLEASPLNEEMIKPKRMKFSNKKELRKIAKQSINFKANLVRKRVLLDSTLSSRPKRRIIKKVKDEVEIIDIAESPQKKTFSESFKTSSKVTALVTPRSPRVIKHSSSNSFVVYGDSPAKLVNDGSSKSSCFNNKNSVQQNSVPLLNIPENKVPFVDLERLNVAQMENNVNPSKQNSLHRFSSARKAVTVPRMSNAVRMKLNTEMSKNFQRGLDVESAKYISPKTLKTKKNQVQCEIPLKSSFAVNRAKPKSLVNSNNVETNSLKVSKNDCVSSKRMKSLGMFNGKELAVCVTKLDDKSEVPLTSDHDTSERTDRLCNGHIIPEALPAVSLVSREASPPPSLRTGGTVPKVKKCRDSNILSFKHLIDKEHRIVSVPLSPIAASYNSIMKSLKNVNQKHKKKAASKLEKHVESKECLRQRFSGRQNAGTYNYKEICLRRYENFVQIILTPGSTVMKNSLNVQVLHEFRDALQQLRRDRFCRVVLVTSTGSTFCQGLDLHSLIHINIEHRKKAAEELSQALKDFLKVLAMFNKPIVAGVHGSTVGLGVTMLPFFDVVYASDKATFHAPYARLGQVPEGAAVLTLPLLLGNAVTSELLFASRRLTATEALHYGLVTRVLWPDKFQEELIPHVKAMANQSSQSMESMKALLRLNLRVKLDATLDSESSLLVQHWCSPECQRNFRKFLETSDDVSFQRQKKDPS